MALIQELDLQYDCTQLVFGTIGFQKDIAPNKPTGIARIPIGHIV
jgi:hypothetical protein